MVRLKLFVCPLGGHSLVVAVELTGDGQLLGVEVEIFPAEATSLGRAQAVAAT